MGQCATNCFSRRPRVFPASSGEDVVPQEKPARVPNTQAGSETQFKEETESALKPETSRLFNHPYSLTSMPISTHTTTCSCNPCKALQTYPRVFKMKSRTQIETRPSQELVCILEPALLPNSAYPSTLMPTATSTSNPKANPSEVPVVPGFINEFVANFHKKHFFRDPKSQASQPWCFRPLRSKSRRSKKKGQVTKPPPYTPKTTSPVGAKQSAQEEDVDNKDKKEEEVVEKSSEEREEEARGEEELKEETDQKEGHEKGEEVDEEREEEKVADKEEEEKLNSSASLPCQEPSDTLEAEVRPGISRSQSSTHTVEQYHQSEPSKDELSEEDLSPSNDQNESLALQSAPELRDLSRDLAEQLMRIFQPGNFGDGTFFEDDWTKPSERKLCPCHWLDSSSEDTASSESDLNSEEEPTIAITYLRKSDSNSWVSEEDWVRQEGRVEEIMAERPGVSGLSQVTQHPCCCMNPEQDDMNDVPSSKRATDLKLELENHQRPPIRKAWKAGEEDDKEEKEEED